MYSIYTVLCLTTILVATISIAPVYSTGDRGIAGEWVKGEPLNATLSYSYNKSSKRLTIIVEMCFRHGGYAFRITGIARHGHEIIVETSVLEYTGPTIQVVKCVKDNVTIGAIDPGVYDMKLYVNKKLWSETRLYLGVSRGETSLPAIIALALVITAIIASIYYITR